MLPLYPELKPYARHNLKVDDEHELYIDESGIIEGIPIVFVHGGPGSGCEFNSRCFFSPEKYRIVLFDQRGAGRSTPHTSLVANTTDDLVQDMEKIREHLGIEKWIVFGGGWGATLSLTYAELHPERVLAQRGVAQAIVLVPESWGTRTVVGFWALDVSRSVVERAYRHVDTCSMYLLLLEARRTKLRGSEIEARLQRMIDETTFPISRR